jgi:SAM-dependent methyltransferase
MTIAELLAADDYVRQRFAPQLADPDYLGIVDLLAALRAMAPADVKRVLDYGCGGSPYRLLFPGAIYHRADLPGGADLDFEYGADSRLPDSASGYDLVLSTQVLEHVHEPRAYLSEAMRMLSPGGHLLLSTHGTYWDHACPYDYWRWTAHGLRLALEERGFETVQIKKITTGTRATLYLLENQLNARFDGGGWYGAMISVFFALMRTLGPMSRHRMADACLAHQRVVDAQGEGEERQHALYLCIAVLARKPMV